MHIKSYHQQEPRTQLGTSSGVQAGKSRTTTPKIVTTLKRTFQDIQKLII
jgi:hypothetical protein